jgi:hypothetical protein
MNPSLTDPNNHVPEVSPDDGWGDAEDFAASPATAAPTALPPRRTVAERASSAAATPSEAAPSGLRIDSNVTRGEQPDPTQRLEVQEITGSVVRLEQVAPSPPKVARQVTFQERPILEKGGKKTRGEGQQWGVARGKPALWIVGAGVVIAMVVVSAMMLLPSINAPNAPRDIPGLPTAGPIEEEPIESVEAMNALLTRQPEAMQIYRSYATASHVDDVIPIIRDGAALTETLREKWRPREISKQWTVDADSSWLVEILGGRACGVLSGKLPDQSAFTAVFTSVDDRLLLDWKATTAFGTATFAELNKSQGNPAEIRGVLSPADFYSFVWPEAEYRSYRFLSPDGENAIWCYALRGSFAEAAITPLFHQGEIIGDVKSSRRVTVRLEHGPEGSLPNQWLIGDMLHPDWVSP